ncbi:MAG: hypothetical protein ACTTHM_05060 [Peptoanaerobacter stomatis]
MSVTPVIVPTPESHSDVLFYLAGSYHRLLPHRYISLQTAHLVFKEHLLIGY